MRILISVVLLLLLASQSFASDTTTFPKEVNCENTKRNYCDDFNQVFSKIGIPTINQLYSANKEAEIYRFFWDPSFDTPLAFQFVGLSDGAADLLIIVFLNRDKRYPKFKQYRVELSARDSEQIRQSAKKAFWWSEQKVIPSGPLKADGAQWCFNLLKSRKHFAHCRHSPMPKLFEKIPERLKHLVPKWREPDADFYTFGMEFIRLSKMNFGQLY